MATRRLRPIEPFAPGRTRKIGAVAAALAAFALLLVAAGPGSCEKKAAPVQNEPPVVTIAQAIEREVTDFVDYTGRMEAQNAVDVRARVTGYLDKTPFKEGDEVKRGDLLFLIDERPYKAQLAQAEAQVALNETALKLARANNVRAKSLSKSPGVITQQDLDQYQATEDQARAQVDASKAAVETYRLNVGYCRITSEIDGQVSRYYYTVGNLVTQDSTLLTTVVSLDPIYVYFDIDGITVEKIKREINEGKFVPLREVGTRPMYIALSGEKGYPHRGNLTFVNNRVDPNTQTLTARGVFHNPRPEHGTRLFTPGMFVRVRLPLGRPHEAVLVAERSLGTDQDHKFVYVVNGENKVEYRRVTTGALQPDGLRVVENGVKAGEWVIVAGLQQAQPDALVNPERTTLAELLGNKAAAPSHAAGREGAAPSGASNEPESAAARRPAGAPASAPPGTVPELKIPERSPSPEAAEPDGSAPARGARPTAPRRGEP
jgi:membrane fusion protein, multidrug efflux system